MKRLLFSNIISCRKAVYICFIVLSICLFAKSAFAQSTQSPEKDPSKDICPKFGATGPAIVESGKPLEFLVKFADEKDIEKYLYKWTISYGEIIEGQGTNRIKVKVKDNEVSFSITATVEIDGLPSDCPRISSASTDFTSCGYVVPAWKISDDVFVNEIKLKEHLHDLIINLQNDPGAAAYVVLHYNEKTSLTMKKKLRAFVINELIKHKIELERLRVVDKAGNKKLSFEFWIIPSGASLPYPF